MPEMIGCGTEGNLGSLSMQLRHICLEYPYVQLEASTNGFDESRRLGSGTAGTVYRGEMPDGSDVAVKVIDLAVLGDDAMVAGFEDEIAVLSKFRHPNLVVLMGWAREGTRRCLIYEFLSGGDVFQRLQKCKMDVAPFLWYERLGVLRNAATGLAHLHNATPHAFHRDIKSANILLGGGSAKMADFGLSCVAKTIQDKGDNQDSMQCKFPSGTPGYTCSTYIRTGKVTEGSEVYSFGMVMLEMLLNLMPAGMMDNALVYPIHQAIRPSEPDAIDRCLEHSDAKAQWPHGVAGDVAQLALGCIHPDDAFRPRFNEICRSLKGIQERYPVTPVAPTPTPVVGFVEPVVGYVEAQSSLPTPVPTPPSISSGTGSAGLNSSSQPEVHKKGITRPLAADRVQSGPSFNIPPARSPQEVGYPGGRCPEGDESISPPKRMSAQKAALGRRQSGRSSEVWPADSDVSLEVGYVHGANVSQLPQHVRNLSITPTIDGDARRIIQIGRHSQQQWFEALLEDPVHRNSVSRISCDITWGGNSVDPSPLLRTLGSNLLLVDGEIVNKDQSAPLRPGSQIRFMFQCDGDVADLLMLVVNAVPQTGDVDPTEKIPPLAAGLALAARKGSETITPTPSSSEEEMWRLELIYAVGLSPQASMDLPVATRTFCFVLAPNRPAVVLGRQHQMAMFEAILQQQKELLAFVSRSHLQLELAAEEQLRVTNLSQNVSLAGSNMLLRGQDVVITSGDTISFAAQAEMVPGLAKMPIIMRGGEEKELAPFLTFRAVKTGAQRRLKSSVSEA